MALLRMFPVIFLLLSLMMAAPCPATSAATAHPPSFRITVVDQETGRGIPAVKLQMTNRGQYWTDNNGVAAFNEPDLMNQEVWFTVETHGYVSDASGFLGIKGVALNIKPGGSATIPMRRINVAQRLYRMTGSGMYRDSLLLGDKAPPIPEPGKAPVMGQDGGDMALFKGRYHWLWGDTAIASFPLGIFQSVSAVSDLPENGGLDPDQGVALRYLRDGNGDIRPIINLKFDGQPYWYTRMRVVKDEKGQEHLLTDYARVNSKMEATERGLLEYSEQTGVFELVTRYPDHPIFIAEGGGTTVPRHTVNGRAYFHHSGPYPVIRYPADYESQRDITTREAFTCLKEGLRFDGSSSQLDRDKNGRLHWGWRKNTSPVTHKQMDKLVKAGFMKNDERWYSLYDIDSGKSIIPHEGSVYWNPFRKRWINILVQFFGETLIGEVWYLEADTPQGPWVYAKKIITHNWPGQACSFYIGAQLPEFDKNGGRTIYLKGSFSSMFGDDKKDAPRHDYSIMVYKLELDDPRLFLPVPVYHDAAKTGRYGTKQDFDRTDLDLVWFAPDRPAPGTVPIYQIADRNGIHLTQKAAKNARTVFFALPADYKFTAPVEKSADQKEKGADDSASSATVTPPAPEKNKIFDFTPIPAVQPVALYEFTHANGKHRYSTEASLRMDGYTRSVTPLCLVWPGPILFNPYGNTDVDMW